MRKEESFCGKCQRQALLGVSKIEKKKFLHPSHWVPSRGLTYPFVLPFLPFLPTSCFLFLFFLCCSSSSFVCHLFGGSISYHRFVVYIIEMHNVIAVLRKQTNNTMLPLCGGSCLEVVYHFSIILNAIFLSVSFFKPKYFLTTFCL